MNMQKMTDEQKLEINRKYFIGGFFLLPWLWFVNFVWFFNEIRKTTCDPRIRRMTLFSGFGVLVWIVLLAIWITTFLDKRVSWGVRGDELTVNIPKGRP